MKLKKKYYNYTTHKWEHSIIDKDVLDLLDERICKMDAGNNHIEERILILRCQNELLLKLQCLILEKLDIEAEKLLDIFELFDYSVVEDEKQ